MDTIYSFLIEINAFALSGFLIGTTSTIMALLVFLIGRTRLHYIWGLFCISVAIWGWGAYKIAHTLDPNYADFLYRITYIGVIFIPIIFLHFMFEFLGKKNRNILFLSYLIGFVFLIINFTSKLLIADMRLVFNQFHVVVPGLLYTPYLLAWIGLVLYAHLLLWKRYKIAEEEERIQIKYFFFAMLGSFSGGSLTYSMTYGIDLYPVANNLACLYTIIITYAIFRKHLFNIKIIATELLVVLIAFLLLLNLFASDNLQEFVFNLLIFLLGNLVGVLLIRSFQKEIAYHAQEVAYDELQRLDEANAQFITTASHQFRTPLSAIKGYISMLLEDASKDRKDEKIALERVYTANNRLIGLVDNLLDVSRMEKEKIEISAEYVQMNELLEDVLKEYQKMAQTKGLQLRMEEPLQKIPPISLDKEKIRQVLAGVIDNAIRYTKKGRITITMEMTNQKGKDYLLIAVADTGEGLATEEKETIFQSFRRGQGAQAIWTEGVGLSLYIARKFVEAHGGKIWAESEGKGKGSKFCIELPLSI